MQDCHGVRRGVHSEEREEGQKVAAQDGENSDRGAFVVARRIGQARRVEGNKGSDEVHQFKVEM